MLGRFLLFIVFVPLIELGLLLELTKRTSLWTTIAVVLTTGVVGMSLVRWQGIRAWREIQAELSSGRSPSRAIVSGVMILIAGALLLTPGLLTDTVGFSLLIPAVRTAIASRIQKYAFSSASTHFRGSVWVSGNAGAGRSPFESTAQFAGAEEPQLQQPQVRVVDPAKDGPRLPDK